MTARIERPNRDALQQALDIFRDAMRPFIIRTLRSVPGRRVEDLIQDALSYGKAEQFDRDLRAHNDDIEVAIDINFFPPIISRNWDAFKHRFNENRSVTSELWLIVEARNYVAHPGRDDLETDYAATRLFDVSNVLRRVNASEQARAVEALRDRLLQPAVPTQSSPTAQLARPRSAASTRAGKLKPWRDVMPPNPGVTQGTFHLAEFAANLQDVYDGHASATEYGNPVSFFNQTFLTNGLRTLLLNTLQRLAVLVATQSSRPKLASAGARPIALLPCIT